MTYASPKTLRRRQQDADGLKPNRYRKFAVTVSSDYEWETTCNFHIRMIEEKGNQGWADSAGAHARALVHMAIERKAAEIQRNLGRARWKAVLIARHELLNVEVA